MVKQLQVLEAQRLAELKIQQERKRDDLRLALRMAKTQHDDDKVPPPAAPRLTFTSSSGSGFSTSTATTASLTGQDWPFDSSLGRSAAPGALALGRSASSESLDYDY